MRIVLLSLTLAGALFWPHKPTLAQGGGQCISLKKNLTGPDVLINTCTTCQVVKVERIRGGGALPTFRTFILQGRSTTDLPFKGPGRTRVVGASPCSG